MVVAESCWAFIQQRQGIGSKKLDSLKLLRGQLSVTPTKNYPLRMLSVLFLPLC